MTNNNLKIVFSIFLAISIALWTVSILQPMLTIRANLDKKILIQQGKKILEEHKDNSFLHSIGSQMLDKIKLKGYFKVHEQTRTIIETAVDLYQAKYFLVAILILFFSIVVPLSKFVIMLLYMVTNNHIFIKINSSLSKWSLADVFAIGIFIAFLAAKSSVHGYNMLKFDAELHSGFYWFIAYCLTTMILGNIQELLLKYFDKQQPTTNNQLAS